MVEEVDFVVQVVQWLPHSESSESHAEYSKLIVREREDSQQLGYEIAMKWTMEIRTVDWISQRVKLLLVLL